jgi:hypothetical protein
MAFLAAKPADFGNRQAGYTQCVHALLYFVKLRRPDYGINTFHFVALLIAPCAEMAAFTNALHPRI